MCTQILDSATYEKARAQATALAKACGTTVDEAVDNEGGSPIRLLTVSVRLPRDERTDELLQLWSKLAAMHGGFATVYGNHGHVCMLVNLRGAAGDEVVGHA